MHIWINLTLVIVFAFCVWIYINICKSYVQLIDECHSQLVEEQKKAIVVETSCELNKTPTRVKELLAFIVFVGYLSYNIL